MTRILVVQMCRLGDVLQTTPMLRGIRRERPDAEITLVLHDGFPQPPLPSSLFDRLVPFPYAAIMESLRVSPESWPEQVERARCWLAELGSGSFDLAINLTHTPLSSVLMSLAPAARVEGGLVAADRSHVVRGAWMTYFWSGRLARAQGCFNLVDLQNWAAGVRSDALPLEIEVPAAARASMAAWLQARRGAERPLLAVQLGASDERKRWPPERVAAAIERLPPDVDVVMVGTRAERPLVERALACLSRPVLNAAGQTSLPELAALLERCVVLLTNDTGTMHVASAVGTRIVDLSTGPVFVHETGPYGEGHLVIEPATACFPCIAGSTCGHIGCRDAFSPGDVAGLVRHALGLGELPHPAGARILTGTFLPNGRIEYRTVWPEASREERLRRLMARMWESTLTVPGACPGPHAGLDVPAERDPADRPALEGLHATEAAALRAAAHAEKIPAAPAARRASLLDAIRSETASMRRLAESEPACLPLVSYLELCLQSCAVTDLGAVAGIYRRELRTTARRARLLVDWMEGRGAGRPS